jgi:hypothetical protein
LIVPSWWRCVWCGVVWCGVVWRFGYEGGGLGSRYVGIVVSMRRGVQAVRCAGGGRKVKQTTI